ncbi:hypothetical protein ACU3L3_07300 [Priestia endophytica]
MNFSLYLEIIYKEMVNMIEEKSWKQFSDSGLFWLMNTTLHTFGWSLVKEVEKIDGEEVIVRVYPARVKFRGFTQDINTDGYIKVSKYLKDNIEELNKEANE